MLLSKKAQSVKEYVAGEQINAGYIKLNSNENPYPPTKAVLKAIKKTQKLNFYPSPKADDLRKALGEMYDINPDNIFVGNGSDEILGLAYMTFFDPKEKDIVFPDITYSFYPVWAELYDINYRTIPVKDDFTIDAGDYLNLPDCQGVILANPNAPTSLELGFQEMQKIVEANQNKVIIIDEAYVNFGTFSCLELAKKYDNVLIVRTFSKAYSLAGLRCGFAIGNAELIKGLEKIRDCFNSYTIDRAAQAGALAAVKDFKNIKKNIDKVIATRDRCVKALREMGYKVFDSKTNFIFLTKQGLDARALMLKLKEKKFLVRHFNLPRIDNYLRITVGTDEQMDKLLEELGKN
ncbi:MAG TPA: histidinol-phosphate transaminase [Clostridia bacterium]|jgi:histidinol-phosphate aminotransferase